MKKTYSYDVRNIYVFKHPAARIELLTNSHKRNMTTIALASSDYDRFAEWCGSEAALCSIARTISRAMKPPAAGTTWSDALRAAIKRAAERELRAQQAYAAELNAAATGEGGGCVMTVEEALQEMERLLTESFPPPYYCPPK